MTLFRKDVLKLTLPIFAEQLFVMSMGMINTIMAANIGKEAVASIGMVDSVNNIFIAFFSALAVGGTVVVAQYTGKGNFKRANDAVKQSLYSALFIALATTLVLWIFRVPLFHFLYGSAEKSVMEGSLVYFNISMWTYPLIAVFMICSGVLRGAGDTKTPMKITIFMNVLNIFFSYFLIYGVKISNMHFNIELPSLGIEGAALGIALARAFGTVIMLVLLFRGSKVIKLTKLLKYKVDREMLKPIFGIGIPSSLESLVFNGGKLITQIYIVYMGTTALAANSIVGSIAGMINIPGVALSIAATTLVGQHMGRGNSKEAEKSLGYVTKMSTVFLLILGLVSLPFSRVLPLLYNNNTDIVALSSKLIIINAFFTPLWSISFILPSGLKGAGDAKYTLITSLIGMWVFRVTLGYLLGIPLGLGLVGVWLGMYVDWMVRGLLYFLRFRSGKWKAKVVLK
jgi:putative MATE family efflux protein